MGRSENLATGRQTLYRPASCNVAAGVGKYTAWTEAGLADTDDAPHGRDWRNA